MKRHITVLSVVLTLACSAAMLTVIPANAASGPGTSSPDHTSPIAGPHAIPVIPRTVTVVPGNPGYNIGGSLVFSASTNFQFAVGSSAVAGGPYAISVRDNVTSSQATFNLTIRAPNVTVALAPSSASLYPTQSVSVTATITSNVALQPGVYPLIVTGLPAGATVVPANLSYNVPTGVPISSATSNSWIASANSPLW